MGTSKEYKKGKNHLSYLAHMAKADASSGPKEREFYDFVADRLGIGPQTAARIWDKPEKVDIKSPQFFDERKAVVLDVVGMMVADKRLEDAEIDLCRSFCEFMEFDAQKAQDLADGLLGYARGTLSADVVNALLEGF